MDRQKESELNLQEAKKKVLSNLSDLFHENPKGLFGIMGVAFVAGVAFHYLPAERKKTISNFVISALL